MRFIVRIPNPEAKKSGEWFDSPTVWLKALSSTAMKREASI